MKDSLTPEQINAVMKALDNALNDGPWDQSKFLQVIGKNIQGIRDNFAHHLALNTEVQVKNPSAASKLTNLDNNKQEVFISLYSSDGNNLQMWERIIANLPKYIISRPIYADEDYIKNLIGSKENKINEAYISIIIAKEDILVMSTDKIIVDKFGKPLLTLKDKSINLENICRFEHSSGTYNYQKGQLVKKLPAD